MAKKRGGRTQGKKGNQQTQALMPKTVVWRPENGTSEYLNHKFRVQGYNASIAGSAVLPILGAQFLAMNSLPNYGNIVALYDQYRIDMWEVTFQLTSSSGSAFPRLTVFPDFDDATAPSTLANATSHPRAHIVALTPARPSYTMTLEPRVAISAYKGAFTGYAAANTPLFIDSATPDVQHYGVKYAVENLPVGQSIDVIWRVWLTARNPL